MRARSWMLVLAVGCSSAPVRPAPVAPPAAPPPTYGGGEPLTQLPPIDAGMPSTPTFLADAMQLSVGHSHSCVVTSGREVACWGDNAVGQTGDPVPGATTPVSTLRSQLVSGLPPIASVSAGLVHTCALSVDGDVYCWGKSGSEIVTTGGGVAANIELKGSALGTPVKIDLGSGPARALALSSTSPQACAAYDDEIRCWQVPALDGKPTVRHVIVAGATSLSLTHGIGCAVVGTNVTCWDSSGTPSTANLGPGPKAGVRGRARQVAMGEQQACVVLETGELRCWSSLAGTFWTFEPMRQAKWRGKRATRAVAVGDSPVCAVDDAGHVDCFWSDEQGLPDQAADASWATTGDGPHPIAGIDGATAIGIGLGRDAFAYGFGCVLRAGEVLCWGDNASGELGDGTLQRSVTPVRVLAPR